MVAARGRCGRLRIGEVASDLWWSLWMSLRLLGATSDGRCMGVAPGLHLASNVGGSLRTGRWEDVRHQRLTVVAAGVAVDFYPSNDYLFHVF